MLAKHIEHLFDDLDMNMSNLVKDGDRYNIELDEGISVFFKPLNPLGINIFAKIGDYPAIDNEELLTNMMSGSLFGRMTGGAVIALDETGKVLTLNLDLPYDVTYDDFYNHTETFLNFLEYWKNELEKLSAEASKGFGDLLY